jgi:hypothetical protein
LGAAIEACDFYHKMVYYDRAARSVAGRAGSTLRGRVKRLTPPGRGSMNIVSKINSVSPEMSDFAHEVIGQKNHSWSVTK